MSALAQFRSNKDLQFLRDPYSPIPHEDRDTFNGLSYFPENDALHFTVEIQKFSQQEECVMPTSTGQQASFYRYGQIQFPVDGQLQTLTVYQGVGQPHLFLPFTDATTGHESYGAGRYLELEPVNAGKYLLDFNLAYNPYCAYSDQWSCPIPLAENRLPVRVEAGEKKYK